ncbi:MAG: fumarate reductase subunit D [Rhodospirillaceae bacterium]|nr:fumarate reductase subunit D [Rhodospirillaceae bacterium]
MAAPSHKPLVWLPFAAGGMLAAFVLPVLILLTTGFLFPGAVTYDRAHAFADNWLGKAVLLVLILLPMWHAAHRLRITAHDFGIHNDTAVRWACYMLAGIGTILTVVFLLAI